MSEVKMRRNEAVEGLRGMTIIMIVVYHIVYRYNVLYLGELNAGIKLMNMWGKIGVSIFLILSSYFLYSSNEEKQFRLLNFYKRKFIRLWPLYFLSTTLTYIILSFIELPDRLCTIGIYVLNVFWINGFVGQPYVDGAHWYMTTLISIILVCGIFKKLQIAKNAITYIVWIIVVSVIKFLYNVLMVESLSILYLLLGGDFVGIACLGIFFHMYLDSANKI